MLAFSSKQVQPLLTEHLAVFFVTLCAKNKPPFCFIQSYSSMLCNKTDAIGAEVQISERVMMLQLQLQNSFCPSLSLWCSSAHCQGQTARLCRAPTRWHWQNKCELLRPARLIEAGVVPRWEIWPFVLVDQSFEANQMSLGGRTRAFVLTINLSFTCRAGGQSGALSEIQQSSREKNKTSDSASGSVSGS